jgi:hypothetical protein
MQVPVSGGRFFELPKGVPVEKMAAAMKGGTLP